MKIQITYCLDKTAAQRAYLLILIPDQKISQLEWRQEYAEAVSVLAGIPVVLVGRTTGQTWQLYGEPDLTAKAQGLSLEVLPWQTIEWTVPGLA